MEKSQKENAGNVIVDEKTGKVLPKIALGHSPQHPKQLTQREEMLAQALVAGHSKARAGEIAGYKASSEASMSVMLNRALARERVQQRIEEIRSEAIGECKKMLEVISGIATNPAAENKDRLKASELFLDKTGFTDSCRDKQETKSINVNTLFSNLTV